MWRILCNQVVDLLFHVDKKRLNQEKWNLAISEPVEAGVFHTNMFLTLYTQWSSLTLLLKGGFRRNLL